MPDREKVIQGLQELIDYLFHEYKVCYHGDEDDCYNRFLQANNAMNLLKKHEPVKPRYENFFGDKIARCGNCNGYIVRYKYCPGCGRAVKWDD